MKNIVSKGKRAKGIKKEIQVLLKGLGKYTIESGLIYFQSLLRSSVLYAAEAMYNVTKQEERELEKIDEDVLRSTFFETVRGCPLYLLYLEAGVVPARFVIKRMKVVFLKVILDQNIKSQLNQFMSAQKSEPTKGDWYSEVQEIMKEFNIKLTEDEIRKTNENKYKKIVKEQTMKVAFKYLTSKQTSNVKNKGSQIKYTELKLQQYLTPVSNLTLKEQREMFALRSQTNKTKSNFRKMKYLSETKCVKTCLEELTNSHITWCEKINSDSGLKFESLLNGTLMDQIDTYKQIKGNELIRNQMND